MSAVYLGTGQASWGPGVGTEGENSPQNNGQSTEGVQRGRRRRISS